MAQLVVDIGNSRTKVAIFDDHKLIRKEIIDRLLPDSLNVFLEEYDIRESIISSVNDEIDTLENILFARTRYTRFSTQLKTGIDNRYRSKETLGLDRLAGIIGAKTLFPGRNCLVIDVGTCITYDVIDESGVYCGGSISPGIKMRLKAMHSFTGRLPSVEVIDFNESEGYDTVTSMLSGAMNGALYELKGFIENYNLQYADLQTILCGGDAIFFDTKFKSSIFAHTLKTEPDLVLIGLNEVIHQQ